MTEWWEIDFAGIELPLRRPILCLSMEPQAMESIPEPTQGQKDFAKHFHCFGRNHRWGTCGVCPRDSGGMIYPEFCEETKRYDHNLTIDALIEQYKVRGLPISQKAIDRLSRGETKG